MPFSYGIDSILTAVKMRAVFVGLILGSFVFAATLNAQHKKVPLGSLTELSAFDLERGYPVEVEGVILFCTNSVGDPYCYLKDGTGGAYIKRPSEPLLPGQHVRLQGIAEKGWENPHIVTMSRLQVLGTRSIPEPLRTISEIRGLTRDEAAKGHLVHLEGVITYCSVPSIHETYCFLQDDTDGIFFLHPGELPEAGDYVSILGTTEEGWYSPTVGSGVQMEILGKKKLPSPSDASDYLILTGKEDARWVELEGLVRKVTTINNRKHQGLSFTLTAGNNINVEVYVNATSYPKQLQGSLVRIRGVAGGRFNTNRQLTGVLFRVPSIDHVEMVEAGYKDPFLELPIRPTSDILAFSLDPTDGRMVHVTGKVTLQHPSGYVVLQDSSGTALIQTETQVAVGDSIQVAGFPRIGTQTPAIEAIKVQILPSNSAFPEPAQLKIHALDDPKLNARLVTLQAKLVDWHVLYNNSYLVFESDSMRFEARVDSAYTNFPLRKGSVVNVTGVIQLLFNPLYAEAPKAHPFLLNLRSLEDLVVVQEGPWWSATHTKWLLGSLVIIIGLILLWTAMLRRQLAHQTRMITQQLDEVQLLKDNAIRSNEMKSAFLAAMSHEIRTPLNGVIGFTSLLEDTVLNEDQENFVRTIKTSGSALLNIINDILDFSKIEAGKLDLDSQPLPLYQCIEEAIDIVSIHAREKQNVISYCIDPEVPVAITSDISRLRQILINLLNNAIKFTEQGQIHVQVLPESGDRILFSITDTGIGIHDEKLPYIFDTFNQGDRATARQFGGTGLGLAICKRLVHLLGGTIEVSSKVGEGSQFSFSIKAKAALLPLETIDNEIPVLKGKFLSLFSSNDQFRSFVRTECMKWGIEVIEYEANSRRVTDAADIILIDFDALVGGEEKAIADARKESIPVFLMLTCAKRSFPEPFSDLPRLNKPLKRKYLLNSLIEVLHNSPLANSHDREEPRGARPALLQLDLVLYESNSLNLKINKRLFQGLGYDIAVFEAITELKQYLSAMPCDLLFVDVDVSDGIDTGLITTLTANQKQNIVALSADDSEHIRMACAKAGALAFLKQPISMKELIRVIQNAGPSHNSYHKDPFEDSLRDIK